MMRDVDGLSARLIEATEANFRGRLLARGQAKAMIRRNGVLPEEAQDFGGSLDRDLLDYGYSLISTALRILEADDSENVVATADSQVSVARDAFLQASFALEAATRNADPQESELVFHRLVAGAASHLAGYAARAYSLMETSRSSGRLSPMELSLADIVMRNLGRIDEQTVLLRTSDEVTDGALVTALAANDDPTVSPTPPGFSNEPDSLTGFGPITLLLSDHYLSSVSSALFAIAYGRENLLETALSDLILGEDAANDIAAPGPWWVFRLTRHMLKDLFETSIRQNLPRDPPHINESDPVGGVIASKASVVLWNRLRLTYVATLLARDRAEIDLWPSQLHVVDRIFDSIDDLVVSLPTSAGKTRIAELCILRCLAQKQRAVFVTPLRALSAQTELILESTFAPLGAHVSSLYGSMGATNLDSDAIRMSDIVVATPEKLDFALRSDPTVLDDVGLIILDEGHMIGPGDREVRYEAQIQRLLRRSDASSRRIVCLSAVFPSNEELDDFVGWITGDAKEGLHKENWRPTQQQFGLVEWRESGYARLTITVGAERPFIPRFLEEKPPTGKRTNPFPQNQNEMTIATAWRLVQDDHTVLIYCPLRGSVSTLAKLIVTLHRQGYIESVMPDGVDIADAVVIGNEWFGPDHDIVKCLKLGVAVHHGALPGPFRREIERLLNRRILKITVASPTLAQGLNLSASAVLFSSLHRFKKVINGSEFANVIGRAGRAFVDTEGLVLYPVYEPTPYKRRIKRQNWIGLTDGEHGRSLQSGLIAIATSLLNRMTEASGPVDLPHFLAYITGGLDWAFPIVTVEEAATRDLAEATWRSSLSMLDTSILSVVGDEEAAADEIIQILTDALRDSLWARQLRRLDDDFALRLRTLVESRAQFLWQTSTPAQRRGWYLAGLGAEAGLELASAAASIVNLAYAAELAIEAGNTEQAQIEFEQLAARVFSISTFTQTVDVKDWRTVLALWLSGEPPSQANEKQIEIAQFIESDIIYRLVWGIEAARVYEQVQDNEMADLLVGSATAALEAGTLNRSAAIILRSGFDFRSAAIAAAISAEANFSDAAGMRDWVSKLDLEVSSDPTWPTAVTHTAWTEFTRKLDQSQRRSWQQYVLVIEDVEWIAEIPEHGSWLRVTTSGPSLATIWTPGFDKVGTIRVNLNPDREGILHAVVNPDSSIKLRYRGPNDWLLLEE